MAQNDAEKAGIGEPAGAGPQDLGPEETAAEMAQGVRTRLDASLGVATTGLAGPGGGTSETPVGTVFIGVADEQSAEVKGMTVGGERDRVRLWATHRALDMVRRRVLNWQ